jgi:4-amino-4-deoxy-L-arabinose transferase-like glycosyltransferase
MPEEPSVLDYLKSKLKFWEQGKKIDIPAAPEPLQASRPEMPRGIEAVSPETPPQTIAVGEQPSSPPRQIEAQALQPVQPPEPAVAILPAVAVQPAVASAPVQEPEIVHNRWPWRSLLALFFALMAQRSWEPSEGRTAALGVLLYALGLALLVWAYFRKEWSLAATPEGSFISDPMKIRRLPLIVGSLLGVAAFLALGGNKFTWVNVTLWLGAILCFVFAFWLPNKAAAPVWPRLRAFFRQETWQIRFTRWGLLVMAVAAVVIFFRVYNLNHLPAEATSDHAEKILDVYDISQGETHIFFPRNTGREAIQMYLTLAVSWLLGTGLTFASLKIGTVFCGLATLPYLYLLGKELGGKRIGLLAVFFAGVAYWPNVISRAGLRFPLYPLFVAPTLYYLIRGLRNRNRNDFIISGLFLGFGLHGYTPFRIVPFVVVIAVLVYLLHTQSRGSRKPALIWLVLLAVVSFIVFMPLARYWLGNPNDFTFRAFSRLGTAERELPGSPLVIFFSNQWNALRMFNWNDGEIWIHSITFRPALDVVSGALFVLGLALLLVRYIRQRHWLDLFLLLAIPLLELPSSLSLAFPNENPDLSRAGAAMIPVFLVVALALDGLLTGIRSGMRRRAGAVLSGIVLLSLAGGAAYQNYDLVFKQFAPMYAESTWNSSEMGDVIKQFKQTYGTTDSVWIVPYPYWVDTRLPAAWAGIPNRDFALWPADLANSLEVSAPKLFMLKVDDTADADTLKQMYPQGVISTYHSAVNAGKDFFIFFVPAGE